MEFSTVFFKKNFSYLPHQVEGQLRGVAARRAAELGCPGSLHVASNGGVHVLDDCVLLVDGTRLSLEAGLALCPPPLRSAATAAAAEQRRRLAALNSLSLLLRLCNALQRATSFPRTVCWLPSAASPVRVQRMRSLLLRGVLPSLRRPANTLALLLMLIRQGPPLLDRRTSTPADAEAARKLAVVGACFGELSSARCCSLPVLALLLCQALQRPVDDLLMVQRLITSPLPKGETSANDDLFDQLVA